jgi:hypothetical protein
MSSPSSRMSSPSSRMSSPSSLMSSPSPVKRPALLGRLVDLNKEKYGRHDEYKAFLRMANKANIDCEETGFHVHSSFKILGKPTSFKEDHNDALLLIYAHYSRLDQTYVTMHTTFERRDFLDSTLSFKELIMFSIDFDLIPKLLCVDDIKLLWDMKAAEHEKDGVVNLFNLDLEGFKDILVRMAIFAYHKPGLKKLIVIVDGFVPKNTKILENFCTYLHLYDIDWMHDYMRSVVKQNMKWEGIGESNGREWQDLVRDKRSKKCSQINYQQHKVESMMKSTVATVATNRGIHRVPPINTFGERVQEPVITMPARADDVVLRKKEGKVPIKDSSLPDGFFPPMKEYVENVTDSVNDISIEGGADSSAPDSKSQVVNASTQSRTFNSDTSFPYEDNASNDETYDVMSVQTSVMSAFTDPTIVNLKRSFYKDYHPMLVREMDKYAYIAPREYSTDLISTGGPFIDLGVVQPGDEVSIFQTITNCTGDLIDMETSAVNFLSANTSITTFTRPLVPGLPRTLTVSFTVETGKKNVLASLDLTGIASRNKDDILLQVYICEEERVIVSD